MNNVQSNGVGTLELRACRVQLPVGDDGMTTVTVVSRVPATGFADLDRRVRQAFIEDLAQVETAIKRTLGCESIAYLSLAVDGKFGFRLAACGGAVVSDFAEQVAAALYVGGSFDFRHTLEALRRDIGADGVLTFAESTVLLAALKPLAGTGATIDAFIQALRDVRADGEVSSEESSRILKLLDELLA